MSGYGFSVGSSGHDDEDRLVTSGIGILPVIPNRTHGPTHELLTVASQSVTQDAKANMTLIPSSLWPAAFSLTLKWDFENKLIAADTDTDSVDDIFYKFDALGRRVGRDDGTANVVYFQDGQQTIADYPSGTAAGSPTYTYVYASYIDEPVMRGGSGGLRYYHCNQQYSITAVTDGGGAVVERYAYSAYGRLTIADASGSVISNSAIANRYTYTGREWDEGLSLYHYRARMYDAVAGRFVSRDPIGYEGNTWNFYEYTGGRPLKYIDPSGNVAWLVPCLPVYLAAASCVGPASAYCLAASGGRPRDLAECLRIYASLLPPYHHSCCKVAVVALTVCLFKKAPRLKPSSPKPTSPGTATTTPTSPTPTAGTGGTTPQTINPYAPPSTPIPPSGSPGPFGPGP